MSMISTVVNNETYFYRNAGLNFLHTETLEWLSDVSFWSDEFVFFYKLIKAQKETGKLQIESLCNAEKELIRIKTDHVDKLRISIKAHEKKLAVLLETSIDTDQDFREEHIQLSGVVRFVRDEVMKFKRTLFSLIVP